MIVDRPEEKKENKGGMPGGGMNDMY